MINNSNFIKEDKFKEIKKNDTNKADLKGDLDDFIFDNCYFKLVSER